jgi:hypothetical protein
MARPTIYNQALADLICERVATHDMGLQQLCDTYDDLPCKYTILSWRHKYDSFSSQYARAKERQVNLLAEQILEIADDAKNDYTIDENGKKVIDHELAARSRLRIDSRKWLASKLAPKLYGDIGRITLEDGTAESVSNVRATVDAILKEKERPY